MTYNNSLTKNNLFNKPQKTLTNINFDDIFEKSLEQDQLYQNTKQKCNFIAQKQKYKNAATCQVDYLEKLLSKIVKNLKQVLSIILDMQNIYTKQLS